MANDLSAMCSSCTPFGQVNVSPKFAEIFNYFKTAITKVNLDHSKAFKVVIK